eukprot:2729234-Rhodomonas_salina.1
MSRCDATEIKLRSPSPWRTRASMYRGGPRFVLGQIKPVQSFLMCGLQSPIQQQTRSYRKRPQTATGTKIGIDSPKTRAQAEPRMPCTTLSRQQFLPLAVVPR